MSSEGGTVDGGRYDVRHGRSSLRARPLQLVPLTFTQSRQEKLRYHSWRIQSVSFHLLDLFIYILLRPRERLLSIVMSTSVSVCLSVCLTARISPELHERSLPIFAHVAYGHGSVLLRRRCVTLCTSGFVNDTMLFSIVGRIAV